MQHAVRRALLMVATLPALAGAQGFGIFEHNTCTMGRGGTAAASPCPDGSAIFFNPAGLAGLKGWRISGGATLIQINGSFTDDQFQQTTELDDPLIPVPHIYVSYGPNSKLGVGVGFFAPYGLQTRWPTTFDGRFVGYDNSIKTFYIQPTVAYQVTPWLKIGGGLDIVHGNVELHQRLDLSTTPVPPPAAVPPGTTFGSFGIPLGTDFADATLEASNTSYGGHFGAIARVNDRLSIGAHYLMKVSLDYTGTGKFTQVTTGIVTPATLTIPGTPPIVIPAGTNIDQLLAAAPPFGLGVFSPGGLLSDQTATATIANPDMFVIGLAFKAREDLTLLADYQWTHWSTFEALNIQFSPTTLLTQTLYASYVNTSGYRLGAEWATKAGMTVRGGYLYHGGAAPDQTVTPLLPEGPRNEFTGGLGIKLGPLATVDLAYQYIHQDDRRGRTRDTPNVMPTTALNNGLYTFTGHLFGATLSVAF